MEIGVFLRIMRSYISRTDVAIGKKTVDLLLEVLSCIEDLGVKVVDIQNETDADFLNGLDERDYELRRNIMCRLCIVSLTFREQVYVNISNNWSLLFVQIGADYNFARRIPCTRTEKFAFVPGTAEERWKKCDTTRTEHL